MDCPQSLEHRHKSLWGVSEMLTPLEGKSTYSQPRYEGRHRGWPSSQELCKKHNVGAGGLWRAAGSRQCKAIVPALPGPAVLAESCYRAKFVFPPVMILLFLEMLVCQTQEESSSWRFFKKLWLSLQTAWTNNCAKMLGRPQFTVLLSSVLFLSLCLAPCKEHSRAVEESWGAREGRSGFPPLENGAELRPANGTSGYRFLYQRSGISNLWSRYNPCFWFIWLVDKMPT